VLKMNLMHFCPYAVMCVGPKLSRIRVYSVHNIVYLTVGSVQL
jgi:hypothetical protein